MKVYRFTGSVVVFLLLSACAHQDTSPESISAHRITLSPEQALNEDKSPNPDKIDIALTNIGEHVMCNAKARVVGLLDQKNYSYGKLSTEDAVTSDEVRNRAWHPGQVWFLGLNKSFECQIPVRVEVSYSYYVQKWCPGPKGENIEPTLKNYCDEYSKLGDVYEERFVEKQIVKLPSRPTAINVGQIQKCRGDFYVSARK